MPPIALILGASGRFGRHMAEAFETAGWQVRRFHRARDQLAEAAAGVDVIVNGWNPAYPQWSTEIPVQTQQLISVAEATGALMIVAGNVYPFGEEAPEVFGPGVVHGATNPLGRVRIAMETAWRDSRARVLILRGGDFLDTAHSGNWFDKVMIKDLAKGRFTYPGPTDRVHAWAYLPDMARAAVMLAERPDRLERFTDMPFPGYPVTGAELHAAVERVCGRSLDLVPMSWWPVRMMALFSPMMRSLVELSYLWSKPHRLASAPFLKALPEFVATPLDQAIGSSVGPDLAARLPRVGHRPSNVDPNQPVARRPVVYVGHARIT